MIRPAAYPRLEFGCDTTLSSDKMIKLDGAFGLIDSFSRAVTDTERVTLADAGGRVLATPLIATENVPPFDRSAMDGYAVCAADLEGEGPWFLPIAESVAAGQIAKNPLRHGASARILTGAPVPEGADAVVMQEMVRCDSGAIVLSTRPQYGENIRRAGEDMREGETILGPGTRLTAKEIGACAAAGLSSVVVFRQVRIALLVTGDEFQPIAGRNAAAGITDVNGPMLVSELQAQGAEIVSVTLVGDDPAQLESAMRTASEHADILLTTGGVSVGDADFVPHIFNNIGGHIVFQRVAIKPGKPVKFGQLGTVFWLGLPGNPVAAFVCWKLFGTRLVARLSGQRSLNPETRRVVLTEELRRRAGRREFRPARIAGTDADGRTMVSFPDQTNSAAVTHLAAADGFAVINAGTSRVPKGGLVEFLPLNWK